MNLIAADVAAGVLRWRGEEGEGGRDTVGKLDLAEGLVAALIALDGAGDRLAVVIVERDAGDPFGLGDQLGSDFAGLLGLPGEGPLESGSAQAEAGEGGEDAASGKLCFDAVVCRAATNAARRC